MSTKKKSGEKTKKEKEKNQNIVTKPTINEHPNQQVDRLYDYFTQKYDKLQICKRNNAKIVDEEHEEQ